ncbi:MAG: hypothetical protein L6R28_14755 [Planctomycetes bacterium]|nr:hypothetical protein [Planctomycetota bacterium]
MTSPARAASILQPVAALAFAAAAVALGVGCAHAEGDPAPPVAPAAPVPGAPASQQEAQAWFKQVVKEVEKAAGLEIQGREGVKFRMATAADAAQILAGELSQFMPLDEAMQQTGVQGLGALFLARYCFKGRGVLLIPENLLHVTQAKDFNPGQKAALLKMALAYACDLALLDSHFPLAEPYNHPGGTDEALAQRAVWEGHARMVAFRIAKALGAEGPVIDATLRNSFMIEPPVETEEIEKQTAPDPQDQALPKEARIAKAKAAAERKKNLLATAKRLHAVKVGAMVRLGEVGRRFVEAVEKARGAKGIIEVLKKPPRRTSEVIVPGDYLDGDDGPSDDVLGQALAKAVATWFQPEQWVCGHSILGALSLNDIQADLLWHSGAGPRVELLNSFDHVYITGQSLIARPVKDDPKFPRERTAAIHLFRDEAAASRFIAYKCAGVFGDWHRLLEEGFQVKDTMNLSRDGLNLPPHPAGRVDEARVLGAKIVRKDNSEFSDNAFYYRKGAWVLEINLDVTPPLPELGECAGFFVSSWNDAQKAEKEKKKEEKQ